MLSKIQRSFGDRAKSKVIQKSHGSAYGMYKIQFKLEISSYIYNSNIIYISNILFLSMGIIIFRKHKICKTQNLTLATSAINNSLPFLSSILFYDIIVFSVPPTTSK